MSDFNTRKDERRQYYERHVKGFKLTACTACSGSGRYDHNGSPRCSSCSGTGKTRQRARELDFREIVRR